MESGLSYIPLIVLLVILIAGCSYYFYLYKIGLDRVLTIFQRHKLENKSLEELEKLLYIYQSEEYFELCAEIRDEIRKRLGYRV